MSKIPLSRTEPKTMQVPFGPKTSNLTAAELSLQRGEFEHAHALLEKRVVQGAHDFKTHNLYGVSLALLGRNETAADLFQGLRKEERNRLNRVKAGFNLGLVQFYRDLGLVGDLSVTKYKHASPGMMLPQTLPFLYQPFSLAIRTWEGLLRGRPRYSDIIYTYLGFAYLQTGDLEMALGRLIQALSLHESFYVTHFVLGRLFLDLYYLADEGNDFLLTQETLEFFEIEKEEILRGQGHRFAVHKETFLDIALQAFLEGRALNPMSPEILLSLSRTYLMAGLPEDAQETLNQAEMYASENLAYLEAALEFHELVQSPPHVIRSLVDRIKLRRLKEPLISPHHILPPYFLL